jgi:hypothetical protein
VHFKTIFPIFERVFTSLGCGKSITYELTENELLRQSHIYRGTSGGCNHEEERHGRQSGVGLQTTRIPINDIYLETIEVILISSALLFLWFETQNLLSCSTFFKMLLSQSWVAAKVFTILNWNFCEECYFIFIIFRV